MGSQMLINIVAENFCYWVVWVNRGKELILSSRGVGWVQKVGH